jgi:DNA (cytosine-5)-methyltransferase 3A
LYWSNIPGIEQPTDKNICLSDIIEQECIGGAKRARYINGVSGKTYQKIELRTDDKANAMTTVKKNSMVSVNNVLRNLHIDEAEQLQTVPINYSSCVSNTQRYKMLGNGWTVSVIAHIFNGLK